MMAGLDPRWTLTKAKSALVRASDLAKQITLDPTRTIDASGAWGTRNTPIFASGTMLGVGSGFLQACALLNCAEAMTLADTPGSTINGLYVNLGTTVGAGRGNRNSGSFVLGHHAATGDANNPAHRDDGFSFHTAVFGTAYVTAGDGGIAGFTRGDFYAFGGIVTLTSTAGLYNHGIIGAEFDVAVEAGAGVAEKMILQLVSVNSDAVKGSSVDAGMLLCRDSSSLVKMDRGIAFGKPGNKWPVDGTIIGTYTTTDAMNAVNGVDFSAVTFSGSAFKSNGFSVSQKGAVSSSTGDATSAATLVSTGGVATLQVTDTGASGANISITGNGAVTPSKFIRVQTGQLQIVNSAYTAAIFTLTDVGDTSAASFQATSPTSGIGYANGAGGTVAQATNKSTGVTLNKVCGAITMNGAALAASTTVTFTLTNSAIAATDMVNVSVTSGAATAGTYQVWAEQAAAGSVKINVRNISGGSLSEALVLTFVVTKAVTA